MDTLVAAWWLALLITLATLPVGLWRTAAYRSGSIDHTPTMRTVAIVAMTLGLGALAAYVVLTGVLVVRAAT
ncbi:hypothetical protein NOMA109596_05505 [Nocardioides marinus]|uniref:Uncharacterized membrane protein (DUF485 family) n=1 Tax=Nocardioides marinus TaxID=374514 RepID=A0A7Z0C3Q0_9ACTN|nr:hypothetical protein [Nocardioides marinus]NYI12130.1 uncharacterized membrane protein (DUF485 family) [Nocardioides marinus]